VLIFTGGAVLLMDAGITIAIIAQLLVTALDLTALKGGWEVAELHTALINLALLVFLFRNISDFRQSGAAEVKPAVEVRASSPVKAGEKVASSVKVEGGAEGSKLKADDHSKSAKPQKKGKA
jgi:hypothetical protein